MVFRVDEKWKPSLCVFGADAYLLSKNEYREKTIVFQNMKVGQKILVIILFIGVMLFALLMVSGFFFMEQTQYLQEVKEDAVPNALLAKNLEKEVVQIQQWLTDISATRAQDGLDDGFDEAEKSYQTFSTQLSQIREFHAGRKGEDLKQIDQIKERFDRWYEAGKQMARAYIEGGSPAGNQQMGAFDEESTRLQEVLAPFIDSQVAEANQKIDMAIEQSAKIQSIILTGMIAAVLVLIFGGYYLAKRIGAPLSKMTALVSDLITRKDFSVRLEENGRDEIAQASGSFNQMITLLRGILLELNQDVHHLNDTATDLASAIDRSLQSSLQTSGATTSMSGVTDQMAERLEQMKERAKSAQIVLTTSTENSKEGGRIVNTTVNDMHQIMEAIQQVSGEISILENQISGITDIVNVIRDVADQTNLLALNAAIEAARAGEQGRGFAVVADEVRKLAERTSGATREIGTMISTIQSSAKLAVTSMDDAVRKADAGAQLASEAGQSMAAIHNDATSISNVFNEIAVLINEQAEMGRHIAEQIDQIAQASAENAAVTNHTADAARSLEDLSAEISTRIEKFKL